MSLFKKPEKKIESIRPASKIETKLPELAKPQTHVANPDKIVTDVKFNPPPVLNPIASPSFIPPAILPSDNCRLSGDVQKGPQFGTAFFKVDQKEHQKHSSNFSCTDVVIMEATYGQHNESCPHVGYWSATKCGCKGK